MPLAPFKAAHATAPDWARAAKACIDGLDLSPGSCSLGFLYVTDDLADDLASILTFFRQTTGVSHWVGSVGIGVCSQNREIFNEAAITAMTLDIEEDDFHVFSLPKGSFDGDDLILDAETESWLKKTRSAVGILHVDPHFQDVQHVLTALGPYGVDFILGGLSSSRRGCHQVADDVTDGAVTGVLFSPNVKLISGLTQGCSPLAPPHVISEHLDNIVIALDGEEALDVFKQDVGDLIARDLNRAAGYIHAAFPVEGDDTGDYLVRNLVGIDPVRGWLAIGGGVKKGDKMMFVRRDPEAARADLTRMVKDLTSRLDDQPRGALYIACVGRSANMFGEPGVEMDIVADLLGDVPLIGFFANGEISNARLYGFTGILILFS